MRFLLALLIILPGFAFAASGGGTAPPKPTQTTKSCKGIKVWDPGARKCVNPQGAGLDQDTLYNAVRELAYAGRLRDAQGVLQAMPDQSDDRVLTYWGFTHRKLGNSDLARGFYDQALAANPGNILARSYMGQGHVAAGEIEQAIILWREIKALGGTGTWAETSLRTAIRTGLTYSY